MNFNYIPLSQTQIQKGTEVLNNLYELHSDLLKSIATKQGVSSPIDIQPTYWRTKEYANSPEFEIISLLKKNIKSCQDKLNRIK